jgi:hypothetical protein
MGMTFNVDIRDLHSLFREVHISQMQLRIRNLLTYGTQKKLPFRRRSTMWIAREKAGSAEIFNFGGPIYD